MADLADSSVQRYGDITISGQATALLGNTYGGVFHIHQATFLLASKASSDDIDARRQVVRHNRIVPGAGYTVETITAFDDSDVLICRGTSRQSELRWYHCEHLGTGLFGEVHREENRDSGRVKSRAVKVLRRRQLQRLGIDHKKELDALIHLSQPNYVHRFVEFYSWYEDESTICLAMEYIPNGVLEAFIQAGLSEFDTKQIIHQVIDGLRVMHRLNLTHRDIKPANIFVIQRSPVWWVKIGDFSICKNTTINHTSLHTQVGTEGYQAPEIYNFIDSEKPGQYSSKVDIWSLGCLMFEMMTKELPFPNAGALFKFCNEIRPSIHLPKQMSNISSLTVQLLQTLLQPKPQNRPSADQTAFLLLSRTEQIPSTGFAAESHDYVYFTDCIGRCFRVSHQDCYTWQDMQIMINLALSYVEKIRLHLLRQNYDISDECLGRIDPDDWENTVRPGCRLTMVVRENEMTSSVRHENSSGVELSYTKQQNGAAALLNSETLLTTSDDNETNLAEPSQRVPVSMKPTNPYPAIAVLTESQNLRLDTHGRTHSLPDMTPHNSGVDSTAMVAGGNLCHTHDSRTVNNLHDTSTASTQSSHPFQDSKPPKLRSHRSAPTIASPAESGASHAIAAAIRATQPRSRSNDNILLRENSAAAIQEDDNEAVIQCETDNYVGSSATTGLPAAITIDADRESGSVCPQEDLNHGETSPSESSPNQVTNLPVLESFSQDYTCGDHEPQGQLSQIEAEEEMISSTLPARDAANATSLSNYHSDLISLDFLPATMLDSIFRDPDDLLLPPDVLNFEDCLGRAFTLQRHDCEKWDNMVRLIETRFEHEYVRPWTVRGHFDLISTKWNTVIAPDRWDSSKYGSSKIIMSLWYSFEGFFHHTHWPAGAPKIMHHTQQEPQTSLRRSILKVGRFIGDIDLWNESQRGSSELGRGLFATSDSRWIRIGDPIDFVDSRSRGHTVPLLVHSRSELQTFTQLLATIYRLGGVKSSISLSHFDLFSPALCCSQSYLRRITSDVTPLVWPRCHHSLRRLYSRYVNALVDIVKEKFVEASIVKTNIVETNVVETNVVEKNAVEKKLDQGQPSHQPKPIEHQYSILEEEFYDFLNSREASPERAMTQNGRVMQNSKGGSQGMKSTAKRWVVWLSQYANGVR